MLKIRDLFAEISRLEALLEIGEDEEVEDAIRENLKELYAAIKAETKEVEE